MSLTDILEGALTLAGVTVVIYGFKKLIKEHYIPWTKEVENELDKHPELDGYKFSDDNGEKK